MAYLHTILAFEYLFDLKVPQIPDYQMLSLAEGNRAYINQPLMIHIKIERDRKPFLTLIK